MINVSIIIKDDAMKRVLYGNYGLRDQTNSSSRNLAKLALYKNWSCSIANNSLADYYSIALYYTNTMFRSLQSVFDFGLHQRNFVGSRRC